MSVCVTLANVTKAMHFNTPINTVSALLLLLYELATASGLCAHLLETQCRTFSAPIA